MVKVKDIIKKKLIKLGPISPLVVNVLCSPFSKVKMRETMETNPSNPMP